MNVIYHLTPRSELARQAGRDSYLPPRFAEDGFVHCTGDLDTLLLVADDYFSNLEEDLLVLAIRVDRLTSPLHWEDAAPLRGSDSHVERQSKFPHVYGPINLAAVSGVALVPRVAGRHVGPIAFEPLDKLGRDP